MVLKKNNNANELFSFYLGIIDSELKFIDVFAGWPGNSHDV